MVARAASRFDSVASCVLASCAVGLCTVTMSLAGCAGGGEIPEPVTVQAKIVLMENDDKNRSGKSRTNAFENTEIAQMEIFSPDEFAGKKIFVYQKVHKLEDKTRVMRQGDRLEFKIDPRLIGKDEVLELSDLLGHQFMPR